MILSNIFSPVKKRWSILMIALAVCVVYAPALRDGFVWDDTALILRDPLIRSWRLIPEGFAHFLFTDATASDFYRPLQRLTYTLEYCAAGFQPLVFHLGNILCHIAAALAFFFFADEFLALFGIANRRRMLALIAALIWAIHPLQSGAVIYISGRADPLSAMFGFASLYFGLRLLRANGRKAWMLATITTVAFIGSALSKESGLIFPALWIAIFALKKNWRGVAIAGGITIFVSVFYLSLRVSAEHIPTPARPPVPAAVRPILIARAVAEYSGLLLLPVNLHVERDVETHPFGFSEPSITGASRRELQTLLGLLLISAAIFWIIRKRRFPAIFSSLLLCLLSYLPVSGIVLLNANVAEHWLYIPSSFLFLAICLTSEGYLRYLRTREQNLLAFSFIAGASIWFLFLGARTFARTFDWRDQRTFVERTIANGGDSSRMLTNLSALDLENGDINAAKANLHLALEKEPQQPFALLNLANVAIKQKDYQVARDALNRAMQNPIAAARAQELLAVLRYHETGEVDLLRLRLASRTGAPDWSIERRYISALDQSGQTSRAITELKGCLANEWYRAETWQMLSELLQKTGNVAGAAHAHEMAAQFDVHLAPAKTPASN